MAERRNGGTAEWQNGGMAEWIIRLRLASGACAIASATARGRRRIKASTEEKGKEAENIFSNSEWQKAKSK